MRSEAGFTLLEALLAAAILSLLSLAALAAFGQAARLAGSGASRLAEAEFAQSLLQEVEVLGPGPYREGTYRERFRYAVAVAPEPPLQPSRYDALIALWRVTASVEDLRRGDGPTTLSQVVAVGLNP